MENMMLKTSQHTSGTTSRFPLELLKKITNNFSEDRIIGSGAYGVVYKGVLDTGEKIAVKKLKNMSQDFDGEKQFHNECTNLTRVQHQNIVRLVGYCYETCRQLEEYGGKYVFAEVNERALCFEYMEGGSLENYVSDKPCPLTWDICYKIIKGVCEGLNHLHNGYKYIISHLDLKPANILLDEDMIPKIGDFGLSRLLSSTQTCTTTTRLGTLGFTPPEYVDSQEISPKYDVFSLGVVIIYIMAGRKQYNDHFDNPSQIIELVSEHWEKRIDATIWAHASQEVNTCIKIALRCVKSDRQERPIISQIVEDLNTIDMAKLSLTCEGTNLQRTEALVYNSNSILMGVHDSATQFDSMECIDYITAVSDDGGDNDNLMHHPMDYLHESIMRNSASTSISEHQDVTRIIEARIIEVDNLEDRKRNPHIRAEGNLRIIVSMGILDTIGNLFQWARSNILSQWSGTQEKMLHDELFRLKSTLQRLIDTLPAMYKLIDRAEWRSHKHHVAEYLAKLKDVVYDADDLLDEFRWYMLKVQVEGNVTQDFFICVIQGRFTKLVNGIQNRMDNISTHLRNMGLHEVTTRFDKSIRPETSSFPNETKIFPKFGSLNNKDPELERIARRIAPKLKGSPLAAKTLGRILGMNLQAKYWNAILESELWKLRQEDTEILPALRLSYMYLPFHLKRCFSLCAVWPKDYKYKKGYLIGIWLALGFVEPQGDIPIEDIACEYFNDLLHRSFFQEVSGVYIIHDLLHDMAQKVSEFDCFIIKRRSDIEKIPANVRHLSILSSTDINYSNLLGLRHFTKLRTLLCGTHLDDEKTSPSLLADWCSEFQCLRVIDFASTHELPASIGTLKHLRHLIVGRCHFKSPPSEFCWLYNLHFVMFHKSKLESLPTDFSKLICLQNFISQGFRCDSMCRRSQGEELYYKVSVDARLGFSFIKNISQLGELEIYNIGKPIRKEHAAEAQLHNKKYLEKLMLKWSLSRNPEESDIEVLRYLQPPTCLKSLLLLGYPGVSLPSLFQPQNLQSSMSPLFVSSGGLENSSVPRITDLLIDGCGNLSSIEHVIHPAYVSSLKKMTIKNCKKLVSVVAERFKDLRCFEEFEVQGCPHIYSQSLVTPSLKRLLLGKENNWGDGYICGNLVDDVDCCSLTYLFLSGNSLTSIQLHKWNLPSLEKLHISQCDFLTSIGRTEGVRAFPSLTDLTIEQCYNLSTLDDLLAEEYLPSIERIHVKYCNNLVSLPGERFGNFSSLKELQISGCNMLSWRGFVLPSSLQILSLYDCGDISACVPSCLQDLASLVTLKIYQCRCITSIPCNLWRTNLTSLENLMIWECEDIVSIGGENAVSEIRNVSILACPNLKELKQPMVRGSYVES